MINYWSHFISYYLVRSHNDQKLSFIDNHQVTWASLHLTRTQNLEKVPPVCSLSSDFVTFATAFARIQHAWYANWRLGRNLERHETKSNGSLVRGEYKLESARSTAMSLGYPWYGIERSVKPLQRMVWNDFKLSQAVCDDVELPWHFLTSHERSKRGPSCLSSSSMGWRMNNSLTGQHLGMATPLKPKKLLATPDWPPVQNFNHCKARTAKTGLRGCIPSVCQLVASCGACVNIMSCRCTCCRCTSALASIPALQLSCTKW